MKTKSPRLTRAQLKRKLIEALAEQPHVYHYANNVIDKASVDNLTASGLILTLTALGGEELITPVLIRNGLSVETIKAIKSDLKRSYDLAVMYKI